MKDNTFNNIYYSPEKHGLQIVTQINLHLNDYDTELLVVWEEISSGRLLFARASGCSCPTIYTNETSSTLPELTRLGQLTEILEECSTSDRYNKINPEVVAAFLDKVREKLN